MGKLREEHGQYPKHERDDLTSYKWCFNNGIKIGPIPMWGSDYGNWTVEITMNGNRNTDPNKYKKDSWRVQRKKVVGPNMDIKKLPIFSLKANYSIR